MADLTQSLYDVEEQMKHRGFQAKMVKPPNNPREAGSGAFVRLQGEEPVSESSQELRRRFLRRLTLALVSYGSSATRTEYLIKNASKRLNVKTKIAVLNSLVILLFPDRRDASKSMWTNCSRLTSWRTPWARYAGDDGPVEVADDRESSFHFRGMVFH